jgi:Tol biopolymer transport system component
MKIATSGGIPMPICSIAAQVMVGASWGEDDKIVYGQYPGDIMQVSANGGTPSSIIKAISAAAVMPYMLPGNKSVLYTDSTGPAQGSVMVQSLVSGKPKKLFEGTALGYLKTGHIIYDLPDRDNLYAVPFDLNTMEVKGGHVPILKGATGHGAHAAVSDSGTLVYVPGTGEAAYRRAFIWIDREGKEETLGDAPENYSDYFKISPNGRKVALVINKGGNYDIWIWDLERKTPTRLTLENIVDHFPIWTLDSDRIIFASLREQQREGIYWKAADGSGKEEELASTPDRDLQPYSLSNDGKTLFLNVSGGESGYDVGMLPMKGDRTLKLLLHEEYDEKHPKISPDGKWIAYQSNESGKRNVYVRSFPEVEYGEREQVSTDGGEFPLWLSDGELLYRGPDATMAVSVETEPALQPGKPERLFPNECVGPFDISQDGKRCLMLKPAAISESSSEEQSPRKINIVLIWFEELKKLAPVD